MLANLPFGFWMLLSVCSVGVVAVKITAMLQPLRYSMTSAVRGKRVSVSGASNEAVLKAFDLAVKATKGESDA